MFIAWKRGKEVKGVCIREQGQCPRNKELMRKFCQLLPEVGTTQYLSPFLCNSLCVHVSVFKSTTSESKETQ